MESDRATPHLPVQVTSGRTTISSTPAGQQLQGSLLHMLRTAVALYEDLLQTDTAQNTNIGE